MEFCPHCGLHLEGHRDFCRHCGPTISWWFQNQEFVDKLGLTEEESWREENGEVHPRGWERKEDGHYHPFLGFKVNRMEDTILVIGYETNRAFMLRQTSDLLEK